MKALCHSNAAHGLSAALHNRNALQVNWKGKYQPSVYTYTHTRARKHTHSPPTFQCFILVNQDISMEVF